MGGLLVIGVLFGWLAAAIWLARRISRAIQMKAVYRTPASIGLAVLIFFLPVADELATRPSFEMLCREDGALKIDVQKIRGRLVKVEIAPADEPVTGPFALIPLFRSHVTYADTSTGEVLAEYSTYRARGGVLARAFRPLGSAEPLTGTYSCVPEHEGTLPERYAFTLIN